MKTALDYNSLKEVGDHTYHTDYSGKTYGHAHECNNCRAKNYFRIPKGTMIVDFLKRAYCHACGCNLAKSVKAMWD